MPKRVKVIEDFRPEIGADRFVDTAVFTYDPRRSFGAQILKALDAMLLEHRKIFGSSYGIRPKGKRLQVQIRIVEAVADMPGD